MQKCDNFQLIVHFKNKPINYYLIIYFQKDVLVVWYVYTHTKTSMHIVCVSILKAHVYTYARKAKVQGPYQYKFLKM